MSLLEGCQVARVTARKAGFPVCVASSSVRFREGLPRGMFVAEDAREVCLGC